MEKTLIQLTGLQHNSLIIFYMCMCVCVCGFQLNCNASTQGYGSIQETIIHS